MNLTDAVENHDAATDPDVDTDVLVVGMGPMGATTGLALATLGVRVQMITMFPWTANTPRAHITSQRAMEVLRDLGVEDDVRRIGTPWDQMGDCVIATSLTGVEIARMPSWGTGDERHGDYLRHSPCTYLDVQQPQLEPILIGAAASRGAALKFNTEFLSLEDQGDRVAVTTRDRLTGEISVVHSRFVVGADGARSKVAEQAGLPFEGHTARGGHVYTQFRADLTQLVAHRPSVLHYFFNPAVGYGEIGLGLLRAVKPWTEWIAGWGFDPTLGDPDMTTEAVTAKIRLLVGDPSLAVDVMRTYTWYVNQQFATENSRGRVFCGGDATHRHPPSSGLGLNTSVQDGHNLAWKLAYVVKGLADEHLLATYSDERVPVARQIVLRANQSRLDYQAVRDTFDTSGEEGSDPAQNAAARLLEPTVEGAQRRARLSDALRLKDLEWNAEGVEKNIHYVSGAVIPDGSALPPDADSELLHVPTTRPGAKLPHVWLTDETGRRFSTLDVVGQGRFTVVTGLTGAAWSEAVRNLKKDWVEVAVFGETGLHDPYFTWHRLREIDEAGALLVRPDGYIAWRHAAAVRSVSEAEKLLQIALDSILTGRPAATC